MDLLGISIDRQKLIHNAIIDTRISGYQSIMMMATQSENLSLCSDKETYANFIYLSSYPKLVSPFVKNAGASDKQIVYL